MLRSLHQSGVFVGIITARSREVASPADQLFYTVEVHHDGGVTTLENMVPQEAARWSTGLDVDLVPFEIGQRVSVGVTRLGSREYTDILSVERPDGGDCP